MRVSATVPSSTCHTQPPPSGAATARTSRLPSLVNPSTAATARPRTRLASEAGRRAAAKDEARSTTSAGRPAVGSTGTWPPGGVGSTIQGVRSTSTSTNAVPRTTAAASAARRALTRPILEGPLLGPLAGSCTPKRGPRRGPVTSPSRSPALAGNAGSADDAAGAVVAGHCVDARDLDRLAGCRGVHHLPVSDVHADVADRAVEEQQVTGLQLRPRDGRAHPRLHAAGVRQADAGRSVGVLGQARAVEAVGAGRTPHVRVADLGQGGLDRDLRRRAAS